EDIATGPVPNPDAGGGDGLCDTDLDCEDLDPCTLDICDLVSGDCSNALDVTNSDCQEPGDLPSGANLPCEDSELPGSSDPGVTACVCAIDSYCCDTMWDSICVTQADTDCGAACSCDEPGADIACSSDLDCAKCDTGDLCLGTWSCAGGQCVPGDLVECAPSEIGGCVVNQCDPSTGSCQEIDDGSCEDADPCTNDVCDMETGECSNELACGTNHPCESAPYPTSKDEEITACVCGGSEEDSDGDGQPDFEGDSWCCDNGWDSLCVSEAQSYCGAICDCADASVDLGCVDDGDCTWCGGDVCVGLWGCHDGHCVQNPGLECPASDDVGCLKNTCDPFKEVCELSPSKEHCDDQTACSVDHCNVETGECSHEELAGCTGEPPYECLGYGEISAEGCDYVASFEGCCDPWGHAVWCTFTGSCIQGVCVSEDTDPPVPCADGTDCTDPSHECADGYCLLPGSKAPETCESTADCGDTMCVDCAGTDPYCGWTGTWYLCGTQGVASEDPAYPMQCPGLTYGE
ncbi:MAG: hypothetical protein VX938_13555, partial [Myxococcota bacterium]|nr:hypothetical protein [Myxococcota bacterium]